MRQWVSMSVGYLKTLIILESITQCPNSLADYEGGTRSERLPVISPEIFLEPDLRFLSLHLQLLQPNPTSFAKTSKVSNAFCERIHENRLQTNE